MACPKCGKQDVVAIGGRNYCANCGNALGTANPTTAAAPQPVPVTPVPPPSPADPNVQSVAAPRRMDISAPNAAPVAEANIPAANTPEAAPIQANTVAPPAPPIAPNPAGQFHGKGAVLDLRAMAVTSPPPPTEPSISASEAAQSQSAAPVPTNQPAPTSAAISKASDRKAPRQQLAAQTNQSDLINKFIPKNPAPSAAAPIVQPPTPPAQLTAAPPTPPPPTVSPSKPSPPTAPVQTVTPPPAPPVNPAQTLPNAAAAQIDNMAKMQASVPAIQPANPAGITSIVAALLAVVVMAGYVWVHNYPKMALGNADSKAGFAASMPHYVPSNFSLSGPVSYSPGEVSLNFNAPGGSHLAIIQRKTDWDSASLLDNYVSQQTDQYLAAEGQGLTVYLFKGNQASWVNHGIWYSIVGNSQLNREQILKIAYSL